MRGPTSTSLLLWLALVGCGGGCSGAAEPGGPTERASTQTTEASQGSGEPTDPGTGEPAPVPAADPGPPPTVSVRGEPDRHGHVTVVVEARGHAPSRLAHGVILERAEGDAFTAVEGVTLDLRRDCATPAPECVELLPGAELRPPAWRGQLGDAQCDCERCADAPEGTYRFVVTSCGGAHRVEGAPFVLDRE